MEEINEKLYEKILDFSLSKKQKWESERKPYAVLFELTPKCNFRCVHCYLQNNHGQSILSTDQVKKIIDILYEKGILFLTLSGGEAILRPDFTEIYLYAKEKGFFVEVFTNGYLIDSKLIDLFREYPPLLVSISLYGACDDTYYKVTGIKDGFTRVSDNCMKLVEAGIRTSLKSPIISMTECDMNEMRKFAEDIGMKMVFTYEIHNAIDGSDVPTQYRCCLKSALKYEFNDFFKQEKTNDIGIIEEKTIELQKNPYVYTCNVATNSFVIDYNGNMLPCMKLRHKGISLLKNEFDDIWEQFKVYKEIKASKDYKCKKCDYVYFCDICPAESDFIYSDAEHREGSVCKAAEIRTKFYKEKVSYDDALKMAEL